MGEIVRSWKDSEQISGKSAKVSESFRGNSSILWLRPESSSPLQMPKDDVQTGQQIFQRRTGLDKTFDSVRHHVVLHGSIYALFKQFAYHCLSFAMHFSISVNRASTLRRGMVLR